MITGLFDHNLTLMTRKLTKKWFNFSTPKQPEQFRIPRNELENFETALKETDWNKILSGVDAEADSNILLTTIKNTIDTFINKTKTKTRVSQCQIITLLGRVVIDFNEIWHADLVI